MRGRPMAAVYADEGAHYTPHFDCVGGDNGRKITCVLPGSPCVPMLFGVAGGI